ncbi:MAG: hypothetical protein HGA45_13890 [Chloroflexales bacterium]|nr:hypothetical protein [Chloroflexales bacterium]
MISIRSILLRWQRTTHRAVEARRALARSIAAWVWPEDLTVSEDHPDARGSGQRPCVELYGRPAAATLYGLARVHYGPVDLRAGSFLTPSPIATVAAWPCEERGELA